MKAYQATSGYESVICYAYSTQDAKRLAATYFTGSNYILIKVKRDPAKDNLEEFGTIVNTDECHA